MQGEDEIMGGGGNTIEDQDPRSQQHTPTHDRRHGQSQSTDFPLHQHQQHQPYPGSPSIDPDPNSHGRYPTPPMPSNSNFAPSISRPNSGLSGNGYSASQSQTYQEQNSRGATTSSSSSSNQPQRPKEPGVVIKVGMVGDAQIGKTSLMVKYVEGSWDEDYIQTLGVNFMEKTISIRNTEITFSIWDLGGQREFVNMLPLVCNDAVAILFMFDLTRKSTLNSIKEWYRQGRGFNKTAIPFLVGTKYDHFVNFPREDQEEISNQVCPIFSSYRYQNQILNLSSPHRPVNLQKQCELLSYSVAQAIASTYKRYFPTHFFFSPRPFAPLPFKSLEPLEPPEL